MKKLVIVESPTKAKTISKFLGKDYYVESSFGHVRDLPKSKMGIDIEGGTFEPTYAISKDKTAQVKKLKDLAAKSDEIIFATDEDREGEAISWHLAHILKVKPEDAHRIVFHEITKHAIEEALAHPRTIDQKLVDAQQARRILDRLVGYELSPFLWKKVARGLSAGRVQSVAVRLTVEREREIQAFIPEEYWTLEGLFQDEKKSFPDPVVAKLHAIKGKSLKKLELHEKGTIDTILKDLDGASYAISHIEERATKRTPPPAFITSSLQQAANNVSGFSAKQTMRLAQQLYEGITIGEEGTTGLITYMRTDSTNLSEKFLTEANTFVQKTYGTTYTLDTPRVYTKKAKGAQEAHEAIRPTDPARTPESIKQYLDDHQFKLYSLIWKRAVATQMSAAKLNKTAVDITALTYTFRANGQTCVFDGWLALYPESIKHEMLPVLSQGQTLLCEALKPEQHFTKPPARYSDATLVKALEERGIGRPSTYAPTIGTIEARGYVERLEDKRLKPTDIAMVVNDLLVEHFKDIVDYDFTALMEQNLDEIATGERDWKPIIATFYHPFHDNLVKKEEELSREDTLQIREVGIDPTSGKPVFARIGRFGPFVQLGDKEDEEKPTFASLGKGQSVQTVTMEEAMHLLSLPKVIGQTTDGKDMTVAIGRFGPYVQIDKEYFSIKEDDPYTITFERAKEIVKAEQEKKAKALIKTFDAEETIEIREGRYGPYIKAGKINAKIPKDTDPTTLTLEQCQELIEEAKKKPKRKWAKKKKSE
ncbi:MAG: type I DNA topoisomerase [Candidatus Magasanikbacteria bacterium CG_4_9_14_0_2_um_filter_41_10]|uniref:DNA topoisomerase 1 n=1 Tax=Candidatus Magasanikbacteria bacterium CG_4_10_14_0_2_um_filter_41_31 TaxID=1974639 RepID=A0A2M7V4Q7_9BACT|nr:MAG: DNA topoisomerase I [Candidatus Magasanikbacteria bacterium CG1_02_41_34]PIZ93546.1 MAG: type I DNA topoisomerase [Candidatus Magasanikbacteria bacterium CG_4_10_14_0_2_um_filter_41_31]PJC53326.1 MAG: type I DNA topoisomerase [Candidatus Magasanikbacteria bacterium CG_4_9_14_0_2_um_filter_41_10]